MVMDAFGGWVFLSMGVSQGKSYVTILWVCCLFSCMWILIAYLFQIYYGLCGNNYVIYCKFLYRWYQSYGFIIVTLDWIHWNAWEDKRKGKIYEFFYCRFEGFGFVVMMGCWNILGMWNFWTKGFFGCFI